ncbi:MAG: rod shape-determining protein MreC [Piscirickettsiaceae bacterium]|nr:rod shape-determining protein MreC [Piscirickettsiaceae bacterium]
MLLSILASIALFIIDSRSDYFFPFHSVLSTIVYPIQASASMPNDIASWMKGYFRDRKQLQEKNAVLEITNLLNHVRIQKMKALERENVSLRELLGSSFYLHERVLVAELLAIDLDPFSQQVIIDKGRRSGVFAGQPVLDATGVMGQVIEVTPFASRVILLVDPSHGIPVQLNRTGLRAVATGKGLAGILQLKHLPHNADVQKGDLLVTSGLGGLFPAGYPVGRIASIYLPQGEAFAEIIVNPAAKMDLSSEVLLVFPALRQQKTVKSYNLFR